MIVLASPPSRGDSLSRARNSYPSRARKEAGGAHRHPLTPSSLTVVARISVQGAARILGAVVLLGVLFVPALGVERFPPPDFTDHVLPQTQLASPRPVMMQYVDVALLAAALALASYLALARRSRRGLFVLAIASLVWFGFVRHGCVCPIGAIQNVTLAAFDSTYVLPLAVIALFTLPLIFTLFFGRTFCAAVCPLGALQELVAVRPVRVPRWLAEVLGLLRYIYLGLGVALAATGTAFVICRYDPLVGFFRLGGSFEIMVFGGCLLLLGVFVGRPYCRFLCPYGALLSLASKVAWRHVRVTPDDCITCRLCEDVCPYGAIDEPSGGLSPGSLPAARRWLVAAVVSLPLLIASGVALGRHLAVPLSMLDPEVQLAEQLRAEETGAVQGTTDASDAFRNTQRPASELYRAASVQRERLGWAGMALGGWVGLVIGAKLISLSRFLRRDEFDPNRAACVSCGRCFWYCPREHVRQGWIGESAVCQARPDST
jgi:NosR/NirI family transcriptional regulator, nitrous oxide reductase regulator